MVFRSTIKAFGLHQGTLSTRWLVRHFFPQTFVVALQAFQKARKKMACDFLNNKKLCTYAQWIAFCMKINHFFRAWEDKISKSTKKTTKNPQITTNMSWHTDLTWSRRKKIHLSVLLTSNNKIGNFFFE